MPKPKTLKVGVPMTLYRFVPECDVGPRCPWRGGNGIDRCGDYPAKYKRCDPYVEEIKWIPDLPKNCFTTQEEAEEKLKKAEAAIARRRGKE